MKGGVQRGVVVAIMPLSTSKTQTQQDDSEFA